MPICVQTSQMTALTTFGTGIAFDFRNQIDPGQQIVSCAVGLSYFQFTYATNSHHSGEAVGQIAVQLVPRQANGIIHVNANLILTDYDGDGAAEPQDVPGDYRATYACVTVIAYIDTPQWPPPVLLGNLWGSPSGTTSPPNGIPVPPAMPLNAFLAGFNLALFNTQADIQGIYINIPSGSTNGSGPAVFSGTVQFDDSSVPPPAIQTVDIAYFVTASSMTSCFQLTDPVSVKGTNGGSGGFNSKANATFSLPNTQWISGVALLINNLRLDLPEDERIAFIAAGATTDVWIGPQILGTGTDPQSTVDVSVPVTMNISDNDPYIQSGSLGYSLLATVGGAGNVLVNPSFETGTLSPWTQIGDGQVIVESSIEGGYGHSGSCDACVYQGTTTSGLQQTVTVQNSGTYTLKAYAATTIPQGVALVIEVEGTKKPTTIPVAGSAYVPYQSQLSFDKQTTVTIQYTVPAGTGDSQLLWAVLDDVTLTLMQ